MRQLKCSLLACLALLCAPAVFAWDEVPLSPPVENRAAFDQSAPAVATDGTNYLVVWQDGRGSGWRESIFGSLLGPDGKVLDPAPIPIEVATGPLAPAAFSARAVWTGDAYLVGWQTFPRDNPAARSFRYVRLDREGRSLGPARVIPDAAEVWGLASAGGRTIVIFTNSFTKSIVFGQLLGDEGEPIGGRFAFKQGRYDRGASVASNGQSFYVVWSRDGAGPAAQIVGAPVSLEGEIGAERILSGEASRFPVVASNGTTYLAVYPDGAAIVTEELDGSGASLGRIVHTDGIGTYEERGLAAYGRGYALLAASSGQTLRAFLLDGQGALTGSLPVAATAASGVALAANARGTVVAWNDASVQGVPAITDDDIYSDLLDADPGRQLLSTAAPRQSMLRIAGDGTGFLSAWIEGRDRAELRIGRISAGGRPLDGEGIVVATGVEQPPALTYDGANYVLAWIAPGEHCSVRVMRISPAGALLDGPAGRTALNGCAVSVGLGANGHESLLAWSTSVLTGEPFPERRRALQVVRVRQDGTIDDTPREVPADRLRALDLSIGWSNDTWLLAWTSYADWEDCGMCDPPLTFFDVQAARLTGELALIDAEPIRLTTSGFERAPSVGANGEDFLVAWALGADYSPMHNLFASRIPRRGEPAEVTPLGRGGAPSVVAVESEYFIAFDDGALFLLDYQRGSLLAFSMGEHGPQHDVRLAVANGKLTAAYLREASEPQYKYVDRAFLRSFGSLRRGRAVRK